MRVSLALLLILSVGGAIAGARLTGGTPADNVGLVGTRSQMLGPAIRIQAAAASRRVTLHRLASSTAASKELRGGTIDVAVVDGRRLLVKRSRSRRGRPRCAGCAHGRKRARAAAQLRADRRAGADGTDTALAPRRRARAGGEEGRAHSRAALCRHARPLHRPRRLRQRGRSGRHRGEIVPGRRTAADDDLATAVAHQQSRRYRPARSRAIAARRRRGADRGSAGGRRGLAIRGARDRRARRVVVRPRLRLLQRGLRRRRRTRLSPGGSRERLGPV